ncbi:chymotrypsin-1-like [Anticarsia gemmatalis]|uniref:chymotrypsin-1-like n=1 Tax=Anticarsia gemmatalis TaxID=129554 RepID=UPI003F75BEC9
MLVLVICVFGLPIITGLPVTAANDTTATSFRNGTHAILPPEGHPHICITNGTVAGNGTHPHMVALTSGGLFRVYVCGASLITPRTIVTAAHCVYAVYEDGALATSLRATVGTNHMDHGGTHYTLIRNVTHPHYVTRTNKNDISLLITAIDVVYTRVVQPIVLCYEHIGGEVPSRVAGWGKTNPHGTESVELMQLDVSTVASEVCVKEVDNARKQFNDEGFPVEPHIELCTFRAIGRGTCTGDSGSPLMRRDNEQLIGVVSWGFPCARGAPDMYARVSAFQDFITSNTVNSTNPTL